MSEFLDIDINTSADCRFQFYQTGLVRKVLGATEMEHFNVFLTPTEVEAHILTDSNGYEAKIDWPNSFVSVIGMMLYLASNTRLYISFAVNQCAQFTNNTKASHETDEKRIFWYLPHIKDNGLVFNPYNKMVVGCYADADFLGLWGHENPQDPI